MVCSECRYYLKEDFERNPSCKYWEEEYGDFISFYDDDVPVLMGVGMVVPPPCEHDPDDYDEVEEYERWGSIWAE